MERIERRNKGFTLTELIVYIGIASFIILVLTGSIIQISRVYSRAKVYQSLSENGNGAMRKLTQEIMAANSINTTDSDFVNQPNELVLNQTGQDYKRFYIADNGKGINQLFLSSETTVPPFQAQAVTADNINVDNFLVDYNDTVPQSLKITLVFSDTTAKFDIGETYLTTVNLRNY